MTNVINHQLMPKQKSLCYFAILEQGEFNFCDSDFNLLPGLALHGSFAFIRYENPALFMIGKLHDYGSHHHAYALLVDVLKQHIALYRDRFFSLGARHFLLPVNQPIYGGGVVFFQGEVVYWHLKSRTFSLHNPACHDEGLALEKIKNTAGFPSNRFISVAQADFFEAHYMRQLFQADGQYIDSSRPDELVYRICQMVQLPSLIKNEPKESNELTF